MKRVLIITYYWPPSGGSGVQRWLKMSKYLPENGWQPVVYTAEDAEYPVEDVSLEKDVTPEAEVIRRPIIEPYTFYKKFLGMKKGEKVKAGFINEGTKKSGWKENISVWIRGNFFIPDARCWWIKPSVRFLSKYLKEHPVDAIISTGPPHSMHLIAKALHKKFNIPWVADFRDPWTEIDYYNDLHLTCFSDKKHKRLEKSVLKESDYVVTVSPDWAKRLSAIGGVDVKTICNGYDWSDEELALQANIPDKFTITYIGVLSKIQNSENFWSAVSEMVNEQDEFANSLNIKMIGQIDKSVMDSINKNGLSEFISFEKYISHKFVSQVQRSSTVLLLFLMPDTTPRAKGLLTGKMYEYMSSGRPIFCVGPENGDAAEILMATGCGFTVGFDDKEKMKTILIDLFLKYKANQLVTKKNELIEKYSRRNLAKEFTNILNELTCFRKCF